MNPDITRDTFERRKHYARVLFQQGRVTLDADANEQTSILLHLLRMLARDIFGPHGGIKGSEETGFEIKTVTDQGKPDLSISPGRYYVDGILCENELARDPETGVVLDPPEGCTYLHQPDYPIRARTPALEPPYLVYLDVWERPIGYLEDGAIREAALGGPDTAARSQVVWQVRTTKGDPGDDAWLADLQPDYRGLLRAGVAPSEPSTDPCVISPESRYRGAENQLYRVEVHTGGSAGPAGKATFKWSRDNGSVCFGVRKLSDYVALLESLGPDSRRSLKVGDWVEVVDDAMVLRGEVCPLARVVDVRPEDLSVTLDPNGDLSEVDPAGQVPLFLRRWDHRGGDAQSGRPVLGDDGALVLQEGEGDKWLALEDGVQIQFSPGPAGHPNVYRPGDYWLIPARVATADVEWPAGTVDGKRRAHARPPHGVRHHYALIASVAAGGALTPRRNLVTLIN